MRLLSCSTQTVYSSSKAHKCIAEFRPLENDVYTWLTVAKSEIGIEIFSCHQLLSSSVIMFVNLLKVAEVRAMCSQIAGKAKKRAVVVDKPGIEREGPHLKLRTDN